MRKITRETARAGRAWTGADRMRLERMAEHQIPAEQIAIKLRRSEAAVRAEARKQRVMLAPSAKPLPPTTKLAYGAALPRRRAAAEPRRSMAARTVAGRPQRTRTTRAPQSESLF